MANFDQMEFNRKIVDILDQIGQEIKRIREEKELSNLAGIRDDIWHLVRVMEKEEGLNPQPVSFSSRPSNTCSEEENNCEQDEGA